MQETLVPVAMIAAMSRNRVIGVEGKLPWHLPEDLKFFKAVTLHKPLIMGRATFASIGKALPNRLNIVVTRDESFEHPGVRVCHDLESALALADDQAMIEGVEEIMVIGGGEIYRQTLSCASRLYLTEIDVEVKGDTFFPALEEGWQEMERVAGSPAEGHPGYDFVRYEREGTAES
ncbi:dihydrofolate reductase [Kushneria indalinina]|uniref:Dihydrofolate reductase n=1 Tax=Kushneria indalinina DSM 14324 TaxID=1122140 RepID=A0A3D9DUI3_9GAMM|nr:dihydrofolate reductase [Kushneria indalinina]REC94341.1 dihydrofolate reductase [Kushneria indalinina DSM 14324]